MELMTRYDISYNEASNPTHATKQLHILRQALSNFYDSM